MKMQLLFEGWRTYLSEAANMPDLEDELAAAHDDGDVDMMDEWMVWARESIQRIIGILAASALHPRASAYARLDLDTFPNFLYAPSEEIKEDLHDDLLFGEGEKMPESLHNKMKAAYFDPPPGAMTPNEAAMNVLKPVEEQIIKELADFGRALKKIWDDPEGAQFKEKLVKRATEDWRAAKALAESIV